MGWMGWVERRFARAALMFAMLTLVCVASTSAEVIDRVLAVVSGNLITLSDVTAARDLGIVSVGNGGDTVGPALDAMIDRTLMLAEVDRFGPPEPTPQAIESGVSVIRSRFESDQAFNLALARSGIDETRLRELVRQGLRLQVYLDLRFSVPPPTEQEVTDYYREHQSDFVIDSQTPAIELVRPRVVEAITAARRRTLVDDWVSGLRRRADIINLYATQP